MNPTDDAAVDNRRLRRTMRDLVALSTLPAIWTGLGQDGIAGSLADALLGMLSLDFVYIHFAGPVEQSQFDVVRTKHRANDSRAAIVRAAIAPLLHSGGVELPTSIPDPFGNGLLQIAVT